MLYELLQRNLSRGMPAGEALASALAERARVERGLPAEEAQGTRRERKTRRKEKSNGARPQD